MKKRYGVILDEDRYREIRTEAVKAGKSVGDWIQGVAFGVYHPIDTLEVQAPYRMERPMAVTAGVATVDDQVKKAIEPEKVKPAGRGRLSKGLGDAPGVTDDFSPEALARHGFRPVPKPGKKK